MGWGEARPRRAHLASRTYGGTGTIHRTGHLNVETHHGRVVAVWFRCQMLPFTQREISQERALEMDDAYERGLDVTIQAIELIDRPRP